MAKGPPVGRRSTVTGRARLGVYLSAEVRDRLARLGFERGVAVSTLLEDGARRVLAAASEAGFEAPQAGWAAVGAAAWTAEVDCPAGKAALAAEAAEGGWRWRVQAGDAVVEGAGALRSRTAAMLEAEAAAAALTPQEALRAAQPEHRGR